ncbi:MAG: D-alanyl-D-alanine carboxypeptidase family protein [Devosia sp.]
MPPARFLRPLLFCLALLLIPAGRAVAIPMLLVDADTYEVLYAEDAGAPWHPASLTKMMTAYVAFAAIKDGRVTLDTHVKVSQNAWNQAPAKSGLEVGGTITLRDALYIMLVKSANDIAVAVAETVGGNEKKFVEQMNEMAENMGLTGTHFVDPNGLHADGQITTARDLAMLALYIRRDYPEYLPIFGTDVVKLGTAKLESNNGLLQHFAGTTGMKTGYICASGLNIVATAERGGRSLIAVVLGGSSARERNELAAELFLKGLSGAVSPTGTTVTRLANTGGDATDMRPLVCGKKAKEYVKQREKDFPMGLKGKPSYLTDDIVGASYVATDLGKLVDVPLPRRRPDTAPQVALN